MNLRELQTEVENAIRAVYEHGDNPVNVPVTLQIDGIGQVTEDYVCADDITLHYDDNTQASGCVLQAWLEEPDRPSPKTAGADDERNAQ